MADVETKLDVILEGFRLSEDHLLQKKRKIYEVQQWLDCDHKEEKLKRESNQLKDELTAATQQVATLEAQRLVNSQQKSSLDEQAREIEAQLEDKQKSVDLMEQAGMEVRDRLLMEVKRFHTLVRLYNPDIPARREAIRQEQQHLALEETRLACELRVLQDNNTELESLKKEMCKYEVNVFELQEGMAHREADMKKQLFAAQYERDRLKDPKCPTIQRLTWELKCAQEEGEYLNSARLGMEREHQKICQKLRMNGDSQNSHSSSIAEPLLRPGHQPQNIVSPMQHQWNFRAFPDIVPVTQNNTETVLQDISRSPAGNIHSYGGSLSLDVKWSGTRNVSTASSKNVAWSRAGEDNSVRSYDGQLSRSTCTSLETGGQQSGDISSAELGGTTVMSTSQGLTPSTPRTFTRNPPPATPQSEVESRPVLPVHLLGHFTCVSRRGEESEEMSDEDDASATRNSASVEGLSTNACEPNNSPCRQPVATTACSTFIQEHDFSLPSYSQRSKSTGHHKDTCSKFSSSNSGGTSVMVEPDSESSSDLYCENVSEVPAKTSLPDSAHALVPGWASLSALDMDQDVPKEMSLSNPSKGDATLGENTECNENISAHTFAPGWASMSCSDIEENPDREVSEGFYNRNKAQDNAYDLSKPQSFKNDSTRGNSTENYPSKLHFKFRKTTMIHMQPSVEGSNTDSRGQNFKSYRYQDTRGKHTPPWSFHRRGSNHQSHPNSHRGFYGYYKSRTSWNYQPRSRRYVRGAANTE